MQLKRLSMLIKREKAMKGEKERVISIQEDTFISILRAAIYKSPIFDETYYLNSHPDVEEAIKNGEISSAIEHFVRTGYFEDFLPSQIVIDEDYYLSENPDIAAAFKNRKIKDLQQHFELTGYKEGRLPYLEFSLWKKI